MCGMQSRHSVLKDTQSWRNYSQVKGLMYSNTTNSGHI